MIEKYLLAGAGTLVKYDDRGFFELVDGLAMTQVSGGLKVIDHDNMACQNPSGFDDNNQVCTGSSSDSSTNTICTGMQHPENYAVGMYDTICIGPGDFNTGCVGGNPWSRNTGCVRPVPTGGYALQENTACVLVPVGGYHSDNLCVSNPACGSNAPC